MPKVFSGRMEELTVRSCDIRPIPITRRGGSPWWQEAGSGLRKIRTRLLTAKPWVWSTALSLQTDNC